MKLKVLSFLVFVMIAVSCAGAPNNTDGTSSGSSSSSYPTGIYVSMTGNDANAGTDKSAPVLTLQIGIMKAVSNSLAAIYVAEGTYSNDAGLLSFTNADGSTNSGVVISNHNLTLYGGCDTNTFEPQGGHYSVLDKGGKQDHVIAMMDVTNVALHGFIFMSGFASGPDPFSPVGGGLFMTNSHDCAISNSFFTNNRGWNGGGVGLMNSSRNVFFIGVYTNLHGGLGGAIYVGTAANQNFFSVDIANCAAVNAGGGFYINNAYSNVITGTIVNNLSLEGGGVNLFFGSYNILSNCLIANNRSTGTTYGGGGVLVLGQRNIIIDSILSNNYARQYGGGAYLSGAYSCVTNSLFYGNTITNDTANVGGGGLYITAQNGIAYGCSFINNFATENSNSFNGFGGGVCAALNPGIVIQNCVFLSNSSSSYGGAIANQITTASYYLTINSNLILSNKTVYNGSGVYSVTSGILLRNNVISHNYNCTAGVGLFFGSGWALIQSNIITSNAANNYGSAAWLENGTFTNIHNLILGDNSAFGFRGIANAVVTSNIIGGTSAGNAGIGIDESIYANTTGHILTYNIFITNRLGNLYYDYTGSHIVTNSATAWTNINNTTYSGASIAQYNIVTNL